MEDENETRKTEIWLSWFGSNDFMQASLNLNNYLPASQPCYPPKT